jgi:hypothetical protein
MKARLEALIHPPNEHVDEDAYPQVPLLTDVKDSVE